jgi:hypothetical protein
VRGLRANLAQFSLLVLVNAFVGGMVGIERSIRPAIHSTTLPVELVLMSARDRQVPLAV